LNAIVPRENFKLTKGNLKAYTYAGDSGKSVVRRSRHKAQLGDKNAILRSSAELLLLPQLHFPPLPPPGNNGPGYHRCEDFSFGPG